jgi:hypothetical protein
MILLPSNPQRAWLRSFWVAVCLLAASIVFASAWLYRTELLWLIVAVGCAFAVGMSRPGLLVQPYRLWNRLARLYAGYAELIVLRIAFLAVCVPAGWIGTRIHVKRPPTKGTLWLSRDCQKPDGRPISARRSNRVQPQGWVGRYVAWAWESKERWRLMLLPYLLVLAALKSPEQKVTVPENIYTLF